MKNTKMNGIVEGVTSKKGLVIGLGVAGLATIGAVVTKKILKRNNQDASIQEAEVVEDNKKSKN